MKKTVLYLLAAALIIMSFNFVQAEIEVGEVPQNVEDQYIREVSGIEIEVWLKNLNVPWDLVFLPDSQRALFTERGGNVRLVENGRLVSEPYLSIDQKALGEGGLMGIDYHPDFPEEPYIYLMYTYQNENGDVLNRVSRFREQGNKAVDEEILVNAIPGGSNHNGGRIEFGPDEKLYITTGDSWNREIAQELDNLGGKILRINPDGSIPDDNPFADSPVYSLGHRNPQGLAWHPENGDFFISDHGPSGEDGLRARDRIKVVEAGDNFGWPVKIGAFDNSEYKDPLIMWENPVPPSGMTFYQGDLFVATLRNESLLRITVNKNGEYEVEKIEHWFRNRSGDSIYGRLRTAVKGPDGYLYILTNNRDGRGRPRAEDDKILRLRYSE